MDLLGKSKVFTFMMHSRNNPVYIVVVVVVVVVIPSVSHICTVSFWPSQVDCPSVAIGNVKCNLTSGSRGFSYNFLVIVDGNFVKLVVEAVFLNSI